MISNKDVSVFQLTDARDNLMKHYKLGLEIEMFHFSIEFIIKAEYYLAHFKVQY